jgi:osmotically-inducible protein OsmY
MRFWREVLCSSLVLGLCTYAYSADSTGAFQKRDTQASLVQAAREALDRDPALALVDVTITRGNAVLSGSVEHYQDKLNAEAAVRSIPGIRNVEDNVQVTVSPVDDATIEKQIEDRLHYGWSGDLPALPDVHVSVANGVVTLSGEVKDPVCHAMALAIAGSTDGVTDVRDRLRTVPDLNSDDEVRMELSKLVHTDYPGVRAVLKDGIVTLMGAVPNDQEKKQLITKVNSMYGVISVNDELIVGSEKRASEMREATLASSLYSGCPATQQQ